MTTPFRHPTDDTLFDFVEGTLDAARVPELQRHLARCAACAAFVTSARVGHARSTAAVEALPETSVASFDAAIDAAWDERVGATTKLPAAVVPDPAVDAPGATRGDTIQLERAVPPSRPRRTPAASRPRRRFVRSAIPVFAVIVVGVLAGTSVYVDGLDSGQSDSKVERTSPRTTDPADSTSADTGSSPDLEFDDGAGQKLDEPAAAPEASAPPADGRGSAAGSTSDAAPEAIVGRAAEPNDEVCIATNDPAQLYLPEGRIPREVIDGPLGTFVVCG